MEKIKLALIGAGNRGQFSYAPYAKVHGYEIEFVAVADPQEGRRRSFQDAYHIEDELAFETAEELLEKPKLADAILICTQDKDHFQQACVAIKMGYNLLLEKPISPSVEECLELQRLAEVHGTIVVVCHVLRYTKFYKTLKEIIDSKVIGEIVSITHAENVAFWHYAHSYVRGNWHVTKDSAPMILAKCCHDMDILMWLIGSRCKRVASYGDLKYFKEENAPEGAPKRCLEGCKYSNKCPYFAPKIYLTDNVEWPTSCLGTDMSYEARKRALLEGPYGKCVFKNDNDVVDHQVAIMDFENGVTVAFTMCAFTNDCDRTMKVMGTKGEIRASMDKNIIEVTDFLTRDKMEYKLEVASTGHSGGDEGIMETFISILKGEVENTNLIADSVHSHIMAFAIEASRLSGGEQVELTSFEAQYLEQMRGTQGDTVL